MPQDLLQIYDGRPGFWQWDTGQKLIVLDKTIDQIHFSNKNMTTAIIKEVYVNEDGMRLCDVPDMILKTPKSLIAYAYAMDDNQNKTICAVRFSVSSRPIPEDYTYEENNRFKDLVDKIESVQDVLESGASVKKFNALSYAEEWAQEYKATGTILSVWNGEEWALYMIDEDYSLYQIGDTDQLIMDVNKLRDLVGDTVVEEQIRLAILALDLQHTYEPLGAANIVRGELKEEINRAKNEEAAITREVHKINTNISNLQSGIQNVNTAFDLYKESNDKAIKKISDDYLKEYDRTELEEKIQSNTDAIGLLTNGVNADQIDGVNDLIKYVNEHGTEVTGIKVSIKSNTDAIAAEKSRAEHVESSLDERLKVIEECIDDDFGSDGDFVSYNEQILTDEQKVQARDNIDALGTSELPSAINSALAQAKESGEFKGDPGKDGKDGTSGVYTLSEGETIEDVPPEYDVVIDPYADPDVGDTGSIQPDWNQNDTAAPDYVKNRPLYEGITEGKVTKKIEPYKAIDESIANKIYEQRETAKYWCENFSSSPQYWFEATDGTGDYLLYDGAHVVRATRRFENTIQFYRTDGIEDSSLDGERLTMEVTFYGEVTVVHKLDPKYLPDYLLDIDIINMYVCSDGEYTAEGIPTINMPDESTTYLVPQNKEGTIYKSWVYMDGAWQFVDTLTISLDEAEGGKGESGKDGKSAYEIAVKNGFEGSEQEWLESLKGKDAEIILAPARTLLWENPSPDDAFGEQTLPLPDMSQYDGVEIVYSGTKEFQDKDMSNYETTKTGMYSTGFVPIKVGTNAIMLEQSRFPTSGNTYDLMYRRCVVVTVGNTCHAKVEVAHYGDNFGNPDTETYNCIPLYIYGIKSGQTADGEGGQDGAAGKDGISATHRWDGTVLTITSASGTSSADLKGEKGDPGKDGSNGADGKDGYTPVKGKDYFTDADKAEMVNAVISALPTWTGGSY